METELWDLLGEASPLDFLDRLTDEEIKIVQYRISDATEGRVFDLYLPPLRGAG
jgi:hypothetical protein